MAGYGGNTSDRSQRQQPDKSLNSIDLKTAVISGAFEGLSKEDIDKYYYQNVQNQLEANSSVLMKPKKGSFQITSINRSEKNQFSDVGEDDDDDSQDDFDDTQTFTEDHSIDGSDSSKHEPPLKSPIRRKEPVRQDHTIHRPLPLQSESSSIITTTVNTVNTTVSTTTTIPSASVLQPKERSSTDTQSRFRVVKIAAADPFKRGRWTCFDFQPDQNKPNPEPKDHVVVTGSETSSNASSIHYVHGQDDPLKNPLAGATGTMSQTLAPPSNQTITSPMHVDELARNLALNGHVYQPENVNSGARTPESFPVSLPLNGNGAHNAQIYAHTNAYANVHPSQSMPHGHVVQHPSYQTNLPLQNQSNKPHQHAQTLPQPLGQSMLPHSQSATGMPSVTIDNNMAQSLGHSQQYNNQHYQNIHPGTVQGGNGGGPHFAAPPGGPYPPGGSYSASLSSLGQFTSIQKGGGQIFYGAPHPAGIYGVIAGGGPGHFIPIQGGGGAVQFVPVSTQAGTGKVQYAAVPATGNSGTYGPCPPSGNAIPGYYASSPVMGNSGSIPYATSIAPGSSASGGMPPGHNIQNVASTSNFQGQYPSAPNSSGAGGNAPGAGSFAAPGNPAPIRYAPFPGMGALNPEMVPMPGLQAGLSQVQVGQPTAAQSLATTSAIDIPATRNITTIPETSKSPRTHRISIGGEEIEVTDDMRAGTTALLEQMASIPGAIPSPTKDTYGDDSGPNSVAIDNKIEQAMDLVKSHLMFAVREEVEVLKEQILDLEENKKRLEAENAFLKAQATKDTLAKLAQWQAPKKIEKT